MNIYGKLAAVQSALKAPKGQYNSFGKYKYRSCEDIVESVKPLLNAQGLLLTMSDELVLIGDRFYVKASATVYDTADGKSITVTALAREEENKKGMDGSQVTGASSSYARKYALNGLFAIDDTKDSDATNETPKEEKTKNEPIPDVAVLRERLIARLDALGEDRGRFAKKHNLTKESTAEDYLRCLRELG